jgi:putative nucleotidyltransferase-like protein
MAESKARRLLRDLAATGALASLPDGLGAPDLAQAARDQGVAGLLLDAIERERPAWAAPISTSLADRRRADLVRTLGQIGLAARALGLLEARGVRGLPLKGAALAETVYDVESDRPMSDVDVLVLERWPEATLALRDAGFVEVARGDHAWAFRDPVGAGILELHRSVVSAPGLFPIDIEGLWARSRRGRGQLERLPSAEDLLVQLALHAAFQHGLTLSLVQWLDFRRLLEREPVDASRLRAVAAAARAEVPLGAALLAAEAVVKAPVPAPLRPPLPASLLRWLEPRLGDPLALVGPSEPPLGRVRWELLPGRRVELLWRTLVLPETPEGDERLPARLVFALGRGLRLARRLPPEPPAVNPHDLGEPPEASAGSEVPFGEEVLRECLASFPQVRLTVTGRCMEPALRHGEKVLLVGASRRRARLGDVVLARQKEGLRLHRLVWGPPLARPGSPWRTKADRGLRLDPPLAAVDVLASVAAVEGRAKARPRRAARALLSLSGGIAARLRMGAAARSEGLT